MSRVAAAKALEQISDPEPGPYSRAQAPGFTIQMISVGERAVPQVERDPVIDIAALRARQGDDDSGCAHSNGNMSCMTCHSSWNPSCYGCHLPQKANLKMPQLHNEGDVTRNYVSYNFQTLRDEVYMLARGLRGARPAD